MAETGVFSQVLSSGLKVARLAGNGLAEDLEQIPP